MDVASFILEAAPKALKIDIAAKDVENAEAALVQARERVKSSKENLSQAKSDFSECANRAEEFNLTKPKFKDAVDRMKTILTDVGALNPAEALSGSDNNDQKPKTRRTRKKKDVQSEPIVETNVDSEPQEGVIDADEVPGSTPLTEENKPDDAPVANSVSVEDVGVIEKEDVSSVNENTDEPIKEADQDQNAEVFTEISELIDDNVENDEVKSVLTSVLLIADWHSKNVSNTPLSMEPLSLSMSVVSSVEESALVPKDVKNAYDAATSHGGEQLANVLGWFKDFLDIISSGKSEFEQFSFSEVSNADEDAETAPEVVETIDEISVFSEEDEKPVVSTISPTKPNWLGN